jgi:2-keto-4-pentenoate hydratase/2-oxohepta-3-ene-1,7-dioic acid hydratase in catechol pathway
MRRIESRPVPPGHLTELHRIWQERFRRSEPEKIVCVGLNYRDHAAEQGAELPAEPLLFAKFPSSLSGPGDPIVLPPESTHVDAEAELVVVIGVEGRRVPEGDALRLVAGYTAANDVTARDLQSRDGQWLRAKGFDTFCPVLPTIVSVSELGEAADLRIVQTLNGDVLQDSSTAELIFGVGRLVAHASTVFTLRPGDLILTGTPAGVGVHRKPPVALSDGDVVEVEIEGIGALANPVVQG